MNAVESGKRSGSDAGSQDTVHRSAGRDQRRGEEKGGQPLERPRAAVRERMISGRSKKLEQMVTTMKAQMDVSI